MNASASAMPQARSRRPLGVATWLLAVLVGLAGLALVPLAAPPRAAAAATSTLTFVSDSTWTPEPSQGRVHVSVDVTATSHTVDTGTRRRFFTDLPITVPPSTANYAAAIGSTTLPVSVVQSSSAGVEVDIAFGQKLYNGQTLSFHFQFDLVDKGGQPHRDLRIGTTVMSFPVYAFGTAGAPGSSATVVFPAAYKVHQEYGALKESKDTRGQTIYSSGKLPDASALQAWFTAEEPVPAAFFRERSVSVGSLGLTLRYWADDPGWADAVASTLSSGVPALQKLIGLPLPAGPLIIEEASSLSTRGYDGSIDLSQGRAEVSYLADPFVVLHEIAHLWFNSGFAGDRWIDEAFASYYADQVVTELRLEHHGQELTDTLRAQQFPLNDWAAAGDASSLKEAYAYAATLEVARQIGTIAGPDQLRQIWQEIRSGAAPYQPLHAAGGEKRLDGPPDWRGLLDYLEQSTGKSFDEIWRDWIVDPGQLPLLDQRSSALGVYRETAAAAGAWELPPDVRRALDAWQFADARILLNEATSVLGQRAEIARRAAAESTAPPDALRHAFEARSVAAASEEANAELSALDALSAARAAETAQSGAARNIGLLGADPQADLAAARQAFAAGDLDAAVALATRARSTWEGAPAAGGLRLVGAGLMVIGVLLLLGLVFWVRRRRPIAEAAAPTPGSASEPAPDGGPRPAP